MSFIQPWGILCLSLNAPAFCFRVVLKTPHFFMGNDPAKHFCIIQKVKWPLMSQDSSQHFWWNVSNSKFLLESIILFPYSVLLLSVTRLNAWKHQGSHTVHICFYSLCFWQPASCINLHIPPLIQLALSLKNILFLQQSWSFTSIFTNLHAKRDVNPKLPTPFNQFSLRV